MDFLVCIVGFLLWLAHHQATTAEWFQERLLTSFVHRSLETLERQAIAFKANDASADSDFVTPLELRDRVLRNESGSMRHRIWVKIKPEIEENPNVHVAMRKVNGRDRLVWIWDARGGT